WGVWVLCSVFVVCGGGFLMAINIVGRGVGVCCGLGCCFGGACGVGVGVVIFGFFGFGGVGCVLVFGCFGG
ncbi:hypothetical protein ACTHS0_11540, partial [Neisseria sp. P0013.S009]